MYDGKPPYSENRLRRPRRELGTQGQSSEKNPFRTILQTEWDSKEKEVAGLRFKLAESEREKSYLQKQVQELQIEGTKARGERDEFAKQLQDLQTEEKRTARERTELAMQLQRAASRREDAKQRLLEKEQRIFVRMVVGLFALPVSIAFIKEDALLLAASLSPLTVYLGTQGFRMGAVAGVGRRKGDSRDAEKGE